jgi:predicted nucleic acid-binding Zn ribbon protein
MSGPRTLDSFSSILSGLSKRLGLESTLLELRLQRRWLDIVGEPTGSHTWPAQIRFKKLYLIVRNPVWLQQLTFLKPELLARLEGEAGTGFVTDIAIRVGEIPSQNEDAPTVHGPDVPSGPTKESWAEVASHTAAIQDPSLRELLREVISRYPAHVPPRPAKGPSQVP